VTYANSAKTELLGVPEAMLAAHGAVSQEVCTAMVEGCLARAGTDYAVAVTGIAGPDGGSAEKPVGTVFIGVASKDGKPTLVERHLFPYERETFKFVVSQTALDLVRRRCVGFL
jgi:nicotinamide-nucleotide amidase